MRLGSQQNVKYMESGHFEYSPGPLPSFIDRLKRVNRCRERDGPSCIKEISQTGKLPVSCVALYGYNFCKPSPMLGKKDLLMIQLLLCHPCSRK